MADQDNNDRNERAILRFLELIARDCEEGLVQVASNSPTNTRNPWAPTNGTVLERSNFRKAARTIAMKGRGAGQEYYFCPALVKLDTQKGKRTSDKDFYGSNVIWVDIDNPGTAEKAKELYKCLPPHLIVTTGTHPHLRQHLYWAVDVLITNPVELKKFNKALVKKFDGDPAATNPGRIMRAPGTINHAKKDGRVDELVILTETDRENPYTVEELSNFLGDSLVETNPPKPTNSVQLPFEGEVSAVALRELGYHILSLKNTGEGNRDNMLNSSTFQVGGLVQAGLVSFELAEQELVDAALSTGLDSDLVKKKVNDKLREGMLKAEVPNSVQKALDASDRSEANYAPIEFRHMKDMQPNTDARDFVIGGRLRRGQVGFISGSWGTGKTVCALEICANLAKGQVLLGNQNEPRRILYLPFEDRGGVENRLYRYFRDHGERDIFTYVPVDYDGCDNVGAIFNDKWAEDFVRVAKRHDIDLLVIDTRDEVVVAGEFDSNSTEGMGKAIKQIELLAKRCNAAALFIAHPPKNAKSGSGNISGSGVQNNTACWIAELSNDAGQNFFKEIKNKNGPLSLSPFTYEIETAVIGKSTPFDEDVTVPYVSSFDPLDRKAEPIELTANQDKFLKIAETCIKEKGGYDDPALAASDEPPSVDLIGFSVSRSILNKALFEGGFFGPAEQQRDANGSFRKLSQADRNSIKNVLAQLVKKKLLVKSRTHVGLPSL